MFPSSHNDILPLAPPTAFRPSPAAEAGEESIRICQRTPSPPPRLAKDCAKRAAIENLAPHELRRTCARLCRDAGGELDQIQFLLGLVSVQTTEKYLGCK